VSHNFKYESYKALLSLLNKFFLNFPLVVVLALICDSDIVIIAQIGPIMSLHNDHRAYVYIKEKLINYEFAPPGYHIDIKKLAETLNLSPIPIREALIRLAEKDLLESVPGKGFFCKEIRAQDVAMSYEFLAILLANACKMAINNNKDGTFSFFLQLSEKISSCQRNNEIVANLLLSHAENFLLGVREEIDNSIYKNTYSNMIEKTQYFRKLDISLGINNKIYYKVIRNLSISISNKDVFLVDNEVKNFLQAKNRIIPTLINESLISLHDKFTS